MVLSCLNLSEGSANSVRAAVQQHLLFAYISWLTWGTPSLKWELGIGSPDLLASIP